MAVPGGRFVVFLALSMAIVSSGCSRQQVLQKFASPEEQTLAKRYIEDLHAGNIDDIVKVADASIQGPNLRGTLLQMAALIPPGPPSSITLVGAYKNWVNGDTSQNLTFEYEFSGKWFLINVGTKKTPTSLAIVGKHINPLAASLDEINRFTLSGKSPLQYLTLSLAAACALFTLYALVVCVRTKMARRKWPWVLFILVGFGKFAVDWTSGAWGITPLALQFFSASALEEFYGPWIVAVSVPVGAIVFLVRRKRLAAESS